MKRGAVVLADFPFQDVPGSKVRPAVVVQNDAAQKKVSGTLKRSKLPHLLRLESSRHLFLGKASHKRAGGSSDVRWSEKRAARAIPDQVRQPGNGPAAAHPASYRASDRGSPAATQQGREDSFGTALSPVVARSRCDTVS